MNKIKRGVSLLLCSLLFGSAVTLGNVADVQAGKQIKTETKQTINNTKTKKKVSDDQTSGKTGRNEENKAGEGAQTDIAESKVTFFVLPVYTQGTTASLLPKMGGNGTKIFVFSGFMIICCSLVLYFRFKRKGA